MAEMIEDEVYSDLDFQQENQKKDVESPDEDYIEDEFEESARLVDQEESKAARCSLTPDVGSAGKVAKKEGVFEVVEDDRLEKAASSGS